MPVKNKKKKVKKIKATKTKPVRKKKIVKKRRKTKSTRSIKIEDLAKQLPEDKYIQALQQKEEGKEELEAAPILKAQKIKFKASKTTLWIIVAFISTIIFIGWVFSLQFTLKIEDNEPGIISSFSNNITNSLDEFKKTMDNLKPNVNKLETAANSNINKAYKSNVNALTDEQLKSMEKKVFPELKNNK